MIHFGRLISIISATVILFEPDAGYSAAYVITDLGSYLGPSYSVGYDINDDGVVTGTFDINVRGDEKVRSFIFDGTIHTIAVDDGSIMAFKINSNEQIVGITHTEAGVEHAMLYDGVVHDLGVLPGGTYSNAAGINSLGHVVGYADPEASQPYQPYHAFLFDGISLQDIGTLGGDQSSAADINNNGKITGFASLADSLSLPHAFIYDGSTMKDIGTLGGVGSGSLGTAINANGHVTGAAGYDDFFLQHAFFYDGTSMRDLGSLSIENNSSIGKDINDHDQIVGYSFTSYGAQHAFIYDPKCGMVDLNSLIDPSSGWIIEEANAINNKGQITGFGRYENGDQRAFILTPVPELSSLCFVSIGFILIAYPIARRARS